MPKILRATITARAEIVDPIAGVGEIFIVGEIDIPADQACDTKTHAREKVEVALQKFVAETSLKMGLIYKTSGVSWRQRGNRHPWRW